MTKTDALAAIHAATSGDLYDAAYEGGTWMVQAVETADTLADFEAASSGYAECSAIAHGTIAGLPCISFERVQVRRGEAHRSLGVIDLGDVRVAVNADLSEMFE